MKAKDGLLCAIIKKHYPLILDDLQKAIFCVDKNGRIVFANSAVATLFNITVGEFCGYKNIRNLWKAAWITTGKSDPVPFEKTPLQQALETGEKTIRDFYFVV